MSIYHLTQINIARIRGVDMNDPVMEEFVGNLDRINALAESSPGFVWRLKDDNNNATGFNPYEDERVIINISVWESIEALEHYVFRTMHADFLRRRKEWFERFGKASTAMWWIPAGVAPTIEEAVERLDHLQRHGPSEAAFDFRNRFLAPGGGEEI